MKAQIIAVANHKGGVGKTTTVASLGSILSQRGFKILVVDLDAQANLTASLCADSENSNTIYDAMTGKTKALPIIKVTETLHLTPASISLAMADVELSTAIARERILSDVFLRSGVAETYDFVFLDCPPSIGLVTLNAMAAATDVIIPLVAEVLPFKGLTMIFDFIDMVITKLNPSLTIAGILITRWESSNLTKGIESKLRESLGNTVYRTKIRKNVRIAEAPLESASIMTYDSRCNGAIDYNAFADEFLSKTNPHEGR